MKQSFFDQLEEDLKEKSLLCQSTTKWISKAPRTPRLASAQAKNRLGLFGLWASRRRAFDLGSTEKARKPRKKWQTHPQRKLARS